MSRIKKLICIVCVCMMVACSVHRYKSIMFTVETKDQIEVKLIIQDGYSLKEKGSHFLIHQDDEEVVEGLFLTKDMYDYYMNLFDEKEAELISKGVENDEEYFYFKMKDGLLVIITWVHDSHTGILLMSRVSEDMMIDACKNLNVYKYED